MQYFLLGIVALAGILMLLPSMATATAVMARAFSLFAGGMMALVGLMLMLRGWAFAGMCVAGAGAYVAMRQMAPGAWWPSGPTTTPRNVSRVTTEHLDVELEHDTGTVRGHVRKGFFAGRDLETMRPVELAHLWADCQFSDPQSAQILEAYLDRVHPTWRNDMARNDGEPRDGGAKPSDEAHMTQEEALDILGLEPGASEEAIRRAHRELMLKLHPDRGGSHVLAAKVNEAKDTLLG